MGWLVLLAIVIVLVLWGISAANRLARAEIKIQEASSGIDVALQKRYDLLIKLRDVAKSYAAFEKETILDTIKLRQSMTLSQQQDADTKLNQAANNLKITAEAYPQLGSNQTFVQLQEAARDTEEHLQAARRLYNANVSAYNQMVVSFPISLIAEMKQRTQQPMYQVDENKKQDVDLNL